MTTSLPTSLPVICDSCRATGMAGDEAFSAIPDILDFEPVQRRAHSNGWTPEHQRAFIAALAVAGSARQAGRAIGKHAFGAEQLRKARGGKSFSDAWDAAIDLYRDRENQRIHANLVDLQAEHDRRDERGFLAPEPNADFSDADSDSYDREVAEARDRIRMRMAGARRVFLLNIADDPEARAAWELLCGKTDWDAATRFAAQPVEHEPFNCHRPDVQVLGSQGLLAELTGGPDNMAECRQAIAECNDQSPAR
ncbi:MAG: hypothetical protein ABIQ32_09540 [Sphingomicrobium sp.]